MKPKNLVRLGILAAICLARPAIAENLTHIQQLLSTRECPECELSDAGLVMASLQNAKLSEANLSRANLSRALLNGADLSGADLRGASLFGANLTGANLTGADLSGADLRQAYLVGVDFTDAKLDGAYLQGAIGAPTKILKVEDVHNWGVAAAQRKNYDRAIDYFGQAIALDSEFALSYLARSIVRAEMGDTPASLEDARSASELFAAQNNTEGLQTSQTLIAQLEAFEAARQQGGSGNGIMQTIGTLGYTVLRLLF
ncbi:MAG: hypothetical protein F6J93_04720 [Oscillatoria sp. SIO1A7]|nr:hypothetical protein [Oscillatoria sp. SIO1A7]